eukprot:GGOE01035826.1.p1 GENE.GGOE01035826.1~~GGOE01035826.1.p1  ORF type:complete len:705 (+),score=194.88 GGOE01035826.1:149-2116(+)
MIHFYGTIAFRLPFAVISQSMWVATMYSAIMACGLLFLLLGHCSTVGRRRIVELHFVFCVLTVSLDAFLFPQQVVSFTALWYNLWIPSPQYHLVLVGPDGQHTVDGEFFPFLQQMAAIPIIAEVISVSTPTLLHIALTGLTPYTTPAFFLTFLSMALGTGLSPGISTAFLIWHLALCLFTAFLHCIIAIVVERWSRSQFLTETLLARELHASRTADSILNHTLKNILSDAAATAELFLAGREERDSLQSAIHCLRRGMRACKDRQVYLKLVAGEYAPSLHTVDLEEFGRDLVAGRDVKVSTAKLTVRTDVALLNLILENAVSNAFKHGHPSDPQVQFAIDVAPLRCDPLSNSSKVLHFTVTNAAHPQRQRLTPLHVDGLLAGKADVTQNAAVSALSDRIGITHCVLAAEVGHIMLHLAQEGDRVTFRASVEAEVVSDEPIALATTERSAMMAFPEGLRFAVLDDSRAARQLLQFHITSWCSPSAVHCFGEKEEDVEEFFRVAVAEADIVILDQHLVYSQSFLGTDIVQQLMEAGYSGFICLRSANDSVEDQVLYVQSGAHCCFGKDLPGKQLMASLKEAYCLFKGRPHFTPPAEHPNFQRAITGPRELCPELQGGPAITRESSAAYSHIISTGSPPFDIAIPGSPSSAWVARPLL